MIMSENKVTINIKKQVCSIIINDCENRNKLSGGKIDFIMNAIEEVENNDDVKVIIFKSSCKKTFASGADINELNKRTPLESLFSNMQKLYNTIEKSSKVTIAIVDGYALGGGFELALACDLRIFTPQAKVGLPELNIGVIPGAGGTQRLTRMVGKAHALDMILTGKIIDGIESYRLGITSYLVESEKIDAQIKSIIIEILKKSPLAINLVKKVIHNGVDISMDSALWMEKLTQAVMFSSDDKKEGTSAFLEKRNPTYKGI